MKNRKSVVIVFTSAYRYGLIGNVPNRLVSSTGGYGDPQTIASQIKENGHTLMTVAYTQGGVSGGEFSWFSLSLPDGVDVVWLISG